MNDDDIKDPTDDDQTERKISPRRRAADAVRILGRAKPQPPAPLRAGPDKAVFRHKTCGLSFMIEGPGKAQLFASECPDCGKVDPGSLVRLGTEFADGSTASRDDVDTNAEAERALRTGRVDDRGRGRGNGR